MIDLFIEIGEMTETCRWDSIKISDLVGILLPPRGPVGLEHGPKPVQMRDQIRQPVGSDIRPIDFRKGVGLDASIPNRKQYAVHIEEDDRIHHDHLSYHSLWSNANLTRMLRYRDGEDF